MAPTRRPYLDREPIEVWTTPLEGDRILVRRTSAGFLRAVLAHRVGVEPAEIAYDASCRWCGDARHGKPRLRYPSNPGVEFNFSRTRHLAVAAVATVEVGVDVEHVDIDDVGALAAVALTLGERSSLAGDEDGGAVSFLRLWTAKEAYLKGTGVGLAADPRTVTFASETPDGWRQVHQNGQPADWRVCAVKLGPNAICSVAVEGPPRPVSVRRLTP